MGESLVQVTEGSGKKLHTWQRTIGANNVEDEIVIPGLFPWATYTIQVNNISIATANDHVLQIMAGASLNVYLVAVRIEQNGNATAVARADFRLIRLTTAGTGGTAVTPAPHDTTDAASGATAMTLPTAKGAEGTTIRNEVLIMRQALLATATQPEETLDWKYGANDFMKPIRIPAGAANGLCIKSVAGVAGATVDVVATIVELNH